jgi:hypothetical protein
MPDSSAELPIDRVIEACDEKFGVAHKMALEQWNEHPEKHAGWLAETDCVNGEDWANAMVQDWGPSKLYDLCVAAKASGKRRVRVSVGDFQEIHPFYRGDRR